VFIADPAALPTDFSECALNCDAPPGRDAASAADVGDEKLAAPTDAKLAVADIPVDMAAPAADTPAVTVDPAADISSCDPFDVDMYLTFRTILR